ncbi:MAG TPA: DinB family protein [Chloroflexota bacterium]|nr:DinB family protein [Chloroflexota bacterium]
MSKEQTLRQFAEARDTLVAAVEGASADPNVRGKAGWNLGQVLAHITAWEEEGIQQIPALAAGGADKEYDDDTVNAAIAASAEKKSLAEIRDSFEATHARLIGVIQGLDESIFASPNPTYDWIMGLVEHTTEHIPDLPRTS